MMTFVVVVVIVVVVAGGKEIIDGFDKIVDDC